MCDQRELRNIRVQWHANRDEVRRSMTEALRGEPHVWLDLCHFSRCREGDAGLADICLRYSSPSAAHRRDVSSIVANAYVLLASGARENGRRRKSKRGRNNWT